MPPCVTVLFRQIFRDGVISLCKYVSEYGRVSTRWLKKMGHSSFSEILLWWYCHAGGKAEKMMMISGW